MPLQPIFLKLAGRPCLIVGAGVVSLDKAKSLLKSEARVRVIAPRAHTEIAALAHVGKLEWTQREFLPSDLDGQFLVIAATDAPAVNAEVYRETQSRGVLCNSVDDIPNCDFFFGSVVSRGDLQIAISTAGESPAVAQRLRREIDAQLPDDLGTWLANLGEVRREVLSSHPSGEPRKALLHELAQRRVCEAATCPSRLLAKMLPRDRFCDSANAFRLHRGDGVTARRGNVYLVGAGPGDPELLTVKALRLIQQAQVILHDDLVPQAILDLAGSAEIENVGKRCGAKNITQDEINARMIEHAERGRMVVRIKCGDPLVFGRAAEEMAALREAGVAFEVVPGITAAFAAAASVQASLTDRNAASNILFSTGHHAQSHNQAGLPALEDATRVVYMPGRDLSLLAEEWLAEGLPGDLPCVLVSRAAQPGQEIRSTTLDALGQSAPLLAPSLLLAGWAMRKPLNANRSVAEYLHA